MAAHGICFDFYYRPKPSQIGQNGSAAAADTRLAAKCLLSYSIVCACSSVTEKTIIGCKARLQFWRYLQYTYHVLTWLFSLLSCLPLGTAYEKNLRRQKEATNYVVHFLSPWSIIWLKVFWSLFCDWYIIPSIILV